ncbi:MAG: hypothetical protein NZM04_04895 [Methylacidiphilales bacterium]|nr:hypothetical protein [Candidatus Methylacidiphilales bacterium]MDW8349385.1 hypothetical protein [Verrucomicrobiae bacterium]
MRALVASILVMGLSIQAGTHLIGMQALAWAQMLRQQIEEKDWFLSLKEVFSGEKPCALCHKVRQLHAESTEDDRPFSIQWNKTEFLLTRSFFIRQFQFPVATEYPPPTSSLVITRAEQPLVPPPKLFI